MSNNPKHNALVRAIRRESRTMVRELGILEMPSMGMPRCHALTELSESGQLTVAQLADRLKLDKSSASRVISKLHKEGLLETRPDQGDRRRKPVRLTASGKEAAATVHATADAQVSEALATLNEEQQQTVIQGLGLYAKALSKARKKKAFAIRPVQLEDNPSLAQVIREVLTEYGANKPGFAFTDPEIDCMYETYDQPKAAYFVIEYQGRVVGGGGYSPLRGGDGSVAELQKMYLDKTTRGLGLGAEILAQCLDLMRSQGYDGCYLETLTYMDRAKRLYHSYGFRPLDAPMGETGHCGCDSYYYLSFK